MDLIQLLEEKYPGIDGFVPGNRLPTKGYGDFQIELVHIHADRLREKTGSPTDMNDAFMDFYKSGYAALWEVINAALYNENKYDIIRERSRTLALKNEDRFLKKELNFIRDELEYEWRVCSEENIGKFIYDYMTTCYMDAVKTKQEER